jgi:hypothetical protein
MKLLGREVHPGMLLHHLRLAWWALRGGGTALHRRLAASVLRDPTFLETLRPYADEIPQARLDDRRPVRLEDRDWRQHFGLRFAGRGLEIGALHRPVPVPPGVRVDYVDRRTHVELQADYPELGPDELVVPTVVTSAETLDGVADPRNSALSWSCPSCESSSSIASTWRQRVEHLAQHPDAVEVLLRDEQLFLPRAALLDVDGREHAPVGELPIEVDLHVAGALELLEDHVVHARAGVDERGGDDGERAALLDVARRAEEALRPLQGVAVHAAREHLARRRHHGVVGAREARDRVEQDDDVLLVLDEALGLLDHHLGHLHVALRRLVEGRADHLAAHRALHVGDLFGPLVDEQHDEVDLGVVLRDAVGDVLQQHRLARARRRDDEAALALADGRHQVEHARRQVLGSSSRALMRSCG